jgi:hypothetical protein
VIAKGANSIQIPNFHDGYFDGFWLGPHKFLHLFLRTVGEISYTLALQNVQALTLSGVKTGNIILDLVFRNAQETTSSDMAELYGVGIETPQAENLLRSAREGGPSNLGAESVIWCARTDSI